MYIKLVGVYISDIHLQVLYTPTSFLQEVYMKFIHLLLSNLIGQNVQAMVQVIVIARGRGFMAVNQPSTRAQPEDKVCLRCHKSLATRAITIIYPT